jgi:hypothetical protein
MVSFNIIASIINAMSHPRKLKNGDSCKSVKVLLCNGALKAVEELQKKYFNEHNGIFLSKPRAINILLSSIKTEK